MAARMRPIRMRLRFRCDSTLQQAPVPCATATHGYRPEFKLGAVRSCCVSQCARCRSKTSNFKFVAGSLAVANTRTRTARDFGCWLYFEAPSCHFEKLRPQEERNAMCLASFCCCFRGCRSRGVPRKFVFGGGCSSNYKGKYQGFSLTARQTRKQRQFSHTIHSTHSSPSRRATHSSAPFLSFCPTGSTQQKNFIDYYYHSSSNPILTR